MFKIIALALTLVSLQAFAADLKVKEDKTPLYSTASGAGQPVAYLAHGRVVKSDAFEVNGFYKIQSHSGREFWIKKTAVIVNNRDENASVEDDVLGPGKKEERHSDSRFPALAYDFGGAFGSVAGASYFELDLGLDTYFEEWISWRNAVFFRRTSSTDFTPAFNAYGLDTSVDGHYNPMLGSAFGMYSMAGVGYRIANHNLSAPFVEASLAFKVAGLHLGAGVKYLMNKLVHDDAKNDLVFSIILGGGGTL